MPLRGRSQVVIVGAGPAGCAAGIVLARAGVDVAVFDRARFPRDKTCGDAISNDAVTLLEELGCGDGLLRTPHALVHAADARFPDGSFVRRQYQRPGMIVPRLALDDLMRRGLEASGARLLQECPVRELSEEGGRIDGVRGSELSWKADLVLAADGYGSLAWPKLGRPRVRSARLALSSRAYFEGVVYPDGAAVSEHCFIESLPNGYAWIFPAVEGLSNVGVYQRADRFVGRLGPLLDGFVASRPDRFAGARQIGPSKSWPLPLTGRPSRATLPSLLAVGDAAKLVDPLTGEGIWQALFSGMLAAETAISALRAGGLGRRLRLGYEWNLQRRLGLAGVPRAWVQQTMTMLVQTRLYHRSAVRRALRWGYGGGLLEITKS